MDKVKNLIIIGMSILIILLVAACGNEVTDNLSDDIDNPTQSQQMIIQKLKQRTKRIAKP